MEMVERSNTPGETGQVSGQKRQGEPSASEYAVQEGARPKSAKTEGSIASPRKTMSHLTPPGPSMEEEGNPKHRMALKIQGYLGHRIDIGRRYKQITYVDLNVTNIREALSNLLSNELTFRLMRRRTMSLRDVTTFTELATQTVTDAVMKALYARLRALHFALNEKKSRYTERPSFPSEAEIPAPLASLVQGIGRLRIRDYPDDLMIAPTYPEGITHEGASGRTWTYAQYMCIVEELKSVGIPFRSIVLKETQGGSWWLFKDRITEARHELVMPFPVTNFTEHGAVLRALLFNNAENVTEHQIADLDAYQCNYGTLLREIGIGDNLLFFRALCHDDESLWRPSSE